MSKRTKSSIARDANTPKQIIYREKRLLGEPYQSAVISAAAIVTIFEALNGETVAMAGEHCFDYVCSGEDSLMDIYKIDAQEMYYQPLSLLLYDDNSISNYYIVVIDETCELRQTDYSNLLLHQQIDNSYQITEQSVIDKIETTIIQLQNMLAGM